MGSRNLCMHMDILRFMVHSKYPEDYEGVFTENGNAVSAPRALMFLTEEVNKGHRVIPLNSGCGNPCSRADRGCTGFDYAGGGCPGYRTEKADRLAAHEGLEEGAGMTDPFFLGH